jgi:hypothetical protein
MRAGFFPVNRMRNEFPGLPMALGCGGAGSPGRQAGKLASPAAVRSGHSLISFDKIGFVFHYFLSRFFATGPENRLGSVKKNCRAF